MVREEAWDCLSDLSRTEISHMGLTLISTYKLGGLNICHVRVRSVIGMWPLRKKCDQCGKRIEGQALTRAEMTFCSKEHVAAYFGAYIE